MSWCWISRFRTDGCKTNTASGHGTYHASCLFPCVLPIDPWHGELPPNCSCGKGVSHTAVCIWCGVASRSRELLLPLCCALLGRLECWVWEHMWTYWWGAKEGPQQWLWDWTILYMRKDWELQLFSLEKKRLRALLLMNVSTWRKGAKRTIRLYSVVPSERNRGKRYKLKHSRFLREHQGTLLSPWEWRSTDTGCPERLWDLHPFEVVKSHLDMVLNNQL